MTKKINNYFLLLILFWNLNGYSQFPPYEWPDTSNMGQYLSRTMNLLNNSNAENKTTVRILVYGQSINAQVWWEDLRQDLETRFPNANIDMRNLSTGGFQSHLLLKTTYFDVLPFYPDLVIFHDYGGFPDKEKIVQIIRENTSAEILWRSSHVHNEDSGLDNEHNSLIPEACEQYHLEFGSFRKKWNDYLEENSLEPGRLLKDNIHLNDHGNYLMAEMHKPYFYYHDKWPNDIDTLSTEVITGKDINWNLDTLKIDFYGNRCDLVFYDSTLLNTNSDSILIFLDGKKPRDLRGVYSFTRPEKGENTLNYMAAPLRILNDVPLIEEEWVLTYRSVNKDHSEFTFDIEGSVTGFDGSGNNKSDFISNSGRIKLLKNDWWVFDAHKYFGVTIFDGYQIKWNSVSLAHNKIFPVRNNDSLENFATVFQGIPNTKHKLKLVFSGDKNLISAIRFYRPYLGRKYSYTKTVELITTASGNGRVSPAGKNAYNFGDKITITALPDSGYDFYGWSGLNSQATSVEVQMDSNMNITANFGLPSYNVLISSTTGGTTNLSGTVKVEKNTELMIIAQPDAGFVFSDWISSVTLPDKTNDTLTVKIDRNILIKANFIQIPTHVNRLKNNSVSIYPNSVNEKVYIKNIHTFSPQTTYEIISITGETVKKSNISGEIDVSALTKGLFIVKIDDKKTTYIEKIIIR